MILPNILELLLKQIYINPKYEKEEELKALRYKQTHKKKNKQILELVRVLIIFLTKSIGNKF